jgi:transcriptional regulator with XRE-family HTH domain
MWGDNMREASRIDMKELGSRIRQARNERNMSQLDLAEACDISVPYVSDIERGKKCFSVDILLRITLALQVSADWLLRIDIPEAQYTHNSEAAAILADCSRDEAKLLLELIESNKSVLRKKQ